MPQPRSNRFQGQLIVHCDGWMVSISCHVPSWWEDPPCVFCLHVEAHFFICIYANTLLQWIWCHCCSWLHWFPLGFPFGSFCLLFDHLCLCDTFFLIIIDLWDSHQHRSKNDPCLSLSGLHEHVSPHNLSWAVLQFKHTLCNFVLDKEVAHIDVFCLFGSGSLPVAL